MWGWPSGYLAVRAGHNRALELFCYPMERESLLWVSGDSQVCLSLGESFIEMVWWGSGVVWTWHHRCVRVTWEVLLPGQEQWPLVLDLGLPVGRYQVICDWLPLVLGLEALGRCCVTNPGWMQFMPSLGSFGGNHIVSWVQMLLWLLSYILSQDWPPLMPGWEPPDGNYSANWNWSLFVALNKRYRAHWGQLLLFEDLWTFQRF